MLWWDGGSRHGLRTVASVGAQSAPAPHTPLSLSCLPASSARVARHLTQRRPSRPAQICDVGWMNANFGTLGNWESLFWFRSESRGREGRTRTLLFGVICLALRARLCLQICCRRVARFGRTTSVSSVTAQRDAAYAMPSGSAGPAVIDVVPLYHRSSPAPLGPPGPV